VYFSAMAERVQQELVLDDFSLLAVCAFSFSISWNALDFWKELF
jgi:hypothetical protein